MEFARALLRLWSLRIWLFLGLLGSVGIGVASITVLHLNGKVYSTASTQMIVDATKTALGDPTEDLTPYTTRAIVFARLMTTPKALLYIGQAAGIPGNLIAATGPVEALSAQAVHVPTSTQGNQLVTGPATYKLNFLQNPELPTVDIYSQAPTTKEAISLANGAVTGFATYLKTLGRLPAGQEVTIRQAGQATGGVVDPTAGKSFAAIITLVAFLAWCAVLLFVTNTRSQIRAVRAERAVEQPGAVNLSRLHQQVPPRAQLLETTGSKHSQAGNGSSTRTSGDPPQAARGQKGS
jgi:hypothetical protein